jgi:hypothetical protein
MKITTIDCTRGGQLFPHTMENGDRFDSIIDLFCFNKLLYTAHYVNTDPSVAYTGKSGILAECACRWICGRRPDTGVKVLYLYQATPKRDRDILTIADLTEDDRTLESIIMNPNHKNRFEITQVLIHPSAKTWDGSRGCLTIEKDYETFISFFEIGDKGSFFMTRADGWELPEKYKAA